MGNTNQAAVFPHFHPTRWPDYEPSTNQAAGADHPEEHLGHEAPARDSQREGLHLQQYAGAEDRVKPKSEN